jgi:hypothetical protein
MKGRIGALVVGLWMLAAAGATADTKVVQATHQDGFSIMGQTQPAKDERQTMFIGDDRMRLDQGSTSILIRLDEKTMYILDHDAETASTIDLPIDIAKMLPAGMADQMMKMMTFEVEVTPLEETREIGPWTAKRWEVTMKSPMVTVDSVYWATQDTDVDLDAFQRLFDNVAALQPGMGEVIDKLKAIDGFVVAQEGSTTMSTMGGTAVKTSQETVSIEEVEPPPGTYEPPPDYATAPFDYMSFMQRRQGQ